MSESTEETKRERALRILRSRPLAPASELLGQYLEDCDPDRGWARVRYTARPEFMNGIGVIQGGFLTAMVDEAMAVACIIKGNFGIIIPTLELKVSFLNGGKSGELFAEGQVEKMGKSVAFLSGRLFDADGEVVVTATATGRVLQRKRQED
ncbi:MAG: PaaI family thioesterase [Minwuia sp.]|nr:PaaI family thioesterase [Minwuia sp.]